MDSDIREFTDLASAQTRRVTLDALARSGDAIAAARRAPYIEPPEIVTAIDDNGDVVSLWGFGDTFEELKPMG